MYLGFTVLESNYGSLIMPKHQTLSFERTTSQLPCG